MSEESLPDGGFARSKAGGGLGGGVAMDAGPARRFWSARRVPAGIVALIVLVASGFLLYDVVSVRAGRQGMQWRRWLAHKLSTVHLDNTWVLASTAAITAIGLWLLVTALTPGLRNLLPMQRPCGDIRAGLERSAAALILRDRAMEISGVQSAKLSVGRRRVKAHAVSHFRDLDDVREELHTTLDQELRQLALARQPKLSVHAKRAKRW